MVKYLDPSSVTEILRSEAPLGGRSSSGYGNRIPCGWKLRIGSRLHRVYAICWSNAPTLYVRVGGEQLLLGDFAHRLP